MTLQKYCCSVHYISTVRYFFMLPQLVQCTLSSVDLQNNENSVRASIAMATATAFFMHIDFQVSHAGNFLTKSIALNEHSLPWC